MMEQPHVLLLETISDGALIALRGAATVHAAPAPDAGLELARKYPIEAIITRGKGKVDVELVDACPRLRVIARAGVGLDNVAVGHATDRGVPVINAPGSNAATVAEHTFGLMLSLQRRLHEAVTEVKSGNWAYRLGYDGDEIRGKTLGILGRGNIGSRVAALAEAFQMKVLFLARTRVPTSDLKSNERNLYELLEEADILSIHLPLTERTRGIIGEKAFARLRPGALIVNTARGEIVDHAALLEALAGGRVGGYATDVMSPLQRESSIGQSVIDHPRVLVTPHMASLTARTFADMCETTVRNVLTILSGRSVPERYVANR